MKIFKGVDEFNMHQAIDDAMEEYGYSCVYLDDKDYVGEYIYVHIFSTTGTSVEGQFKDWDKAREMILTKMEEHDFQIQCKIDDIEVYRQLPEENFNYAGTLMVRRLDTTDTNANADTSASAGAGDEQQSSEQSAN